MSRLIQPRGLKSIPDGINEGLQKSRLIQPRGLKCDIHDSSYEKETSRLIQPRGLKFLLFNLNLFLLWSRLIQPRGLKCVMDYRGIIMNRRGLYSLVDWNTKNRLLRMFIRSRGLYSLVDWNYFIRRTTSAPFMSRLIQPRGLKCDYKRESIVDSCRGLYSLVDWNTPIARSNRCATVEAYTASWIEIHIT